MKFKNRKEAIEYIKRFPEAEAEFVSGWGRTLEQYFFDYADHEPDIWYDVISDLALPDPKRKAA